MVKKSATLPTTWTTNWVRNCNLLLSWSDAVVRFATIDAHDHAQYIARRAMRIENQSVRKVVCEHGAYASDLLEWIQLGIAAHNNHPMVPLECVVTDVDLSSYRSAWNKHVQSELQSTALLAPLSDTIEGVAEDIRLKMSTLRLEDPGDYSSYSDYSEDDTETEAEDDVEEEEEEEDEEEESALRELPTTIKKTIAERLAPEEPPRAQKKNNKKK